MTENQALLYKERLKKENDKGFGGGRHNRDRDGEQPRYDRPIADRVVAGRYQVLDQRSRRFSKKGKAVDCFKDREAQFVTAAVQLPQASELIRDARFQLLIVRGGESRSQNQAVADVLSQSMTTNMTIPQAHIVAGVLRETYKQLGINYESTYDYLRRESPSVMHKWQKKMEKRCSVMRPGSCKGSDSESSSSDEDRAAKPPEPPLVAPRDDASQDVQTGLKTMLQAMSANGSGNPAEKKRPRDAAAGAPQPTNLDARMSDAGQRSATATGSGTVPPASGSGSNGG